MAEEDEVGPEQAFKDLQSEVALLRRAMDGLPAALKAAKPADTTATLVEIVRTLKDVDGHLVALERYPVLRMTPEQHTTAILNAGDAVTRQAVQTLDRATAETKTERQQLALLVGSVRGQRQQRSWLLRVGIGALVLGLLVSPLLSALLPFGLDGQIAAFIMQTDRWNAGGALMAAEDPKAWRDLGEGARVWKGNGAAIEACRDAAAKTKKDQHCVVVVPAP